MQGSATRVLCLVEINWIVVFPMVSVKADLAVGGVERGGTQQTQVR